MCRRELSMSNLYNAQNPTHDLALADRYFSLPPSERETWRTESQCRVAFQESIRQLYEQGNEERARELWARYQEGHITMPDSTYVCDGVTVAFEIITDHYGREEIAAKEEAAATLGAEIEFVKV